jgi:hypothetical protein
VQKNAQAEKFCTNMCKNGNPANYANVVRCYLCGSWTGRRFKLRQEQGEIKAPDGFTQDKADPPGSDIQGGRRPERKAPRATAASVREKVG